MKITSDNSIKINKPEEYKLDESKIKTLDDVINILLLADIKIYSIFTNFKKLKPYLKKLK